MDSILLEALAATREAMAEIAGVAAEKKLRLRHDILETAASRLDLASSPPDHVTRLALFALQLRDTADELRRSHRVVVEALREVMD